MNTNRLGLGLAIGGVVVAATIIGIAIAVSGNGTSTASGVCADEGQSAPCFNASGQWVSQNGAIASPSTTYRYTAPSTTSYAPPPIQNGDFTINLKTTSKQCFGSAGCNVVVQPALNYKYDAARMASYGTCDVTYSISGDESGEVVETAYGEGGLQFRTASSVLSTRSSKVQLSAAVTDVTCR
jgi:hypothetical protein